MKLFESDLIYLRSPELNSVKTSINSDIYMVRLVVNLRLRRRSPQSWLPPTRRKEISMPKASAKITPKADTHFDAAEYVDLMVDLGRGPLVVRGANGDLGLFERSVRLSKTQEKALFAMLEKSHAAQDADDLIIAECVQRGLVEHR
jgi:hypothetical protein